MPACPSAFRAGCFQGGQHPDANLLAALVEKSSHGEGNEPRCSTTSASVRNAERLQPSPCLRKVRFRTHSRGGGAALDAPWLVLRWGAMAAVLGALTVVVVVRPGMWKGHPEISQEMRPPVPAGNIRALPPPPSAPPLALPPSETVRAKARVEARESAGEMAAAGSAQIASRAGPWGSRRSRPRPGSK